jgi:hypothetical protein
LNIDPAMKLKSFGCSFIFGSDLSDAGTGTVSPAPSQKTWPALLAKAYDLDYECLARPGGGNLQILDNIIAQTVDPEPALFVICWTWVDRFDYWTDHQNWADNKFGSNQWHTIRPGTTSELAKFYYKQLHHAYSDKLNSLLYAKSAVDLLTQKNIPFIMTCMDDLMFETAWHTSNSVQSLQSCIQPHMTQFEGRTFLDWSRHHGYAESALMHPLEQAHQAAADHMIKIFDKQKIIDPVLQVRA